MCDKYQRDAHDKMYNNKKVEMNKHQVKSDEHHKSNKVLRSH
jgi:hypothetical protein